jgi:hypothetical protein
MAKSKRYQVYVWVTTNSGHAWLTRGISAQDQVAIGKNTFKSNTRDVSRYLNNSSEIKDL